MLLCKVGRHQVAQDCPVVLPRVAEGQCSRGNDAIQCLAILQLAVCIDASSTLFHCDSKCWSSVAVVSQCISSFTAQATQNRFVHSLAVTHQACNRWHHIMTRNAIDKGNDDFETVTSRKVDTPPHL